MEKSEIDYIYIPSPTKTFKNEGAIENPRFSCKTRGFQNPKKINGLVRAKYGFSIG